MFSPIGNRKKIILSTLLMVLLICGMQGVSYGQELSVSLSGPSVPIELRTNFDLIVTITNTGTRSSTATNLSVYRSTGLGSEILEPSGSTDVPIIPAGAGWSSTIPLTAPNTTALYRYRIALSVMSGDTSANNSASVQVAVGQSLSNLTIARTLSANPSHSVTPGGYVTLTASVSNTGGAASPSTRFYVYRSNTGVATDSGTLVHSFSDNIPANVTGRAVSISQVPVPTSPSTYYYRVQIGTDRTKTSNYTAVIVTNPVDLSVGTPTVDKSTVAPGETFTLSTTVRNVGAGNFTGTTTLRHFRSADTTLNRTDGSDTKVGTDTIYTLSGSDGTTSVDRTLTAPSEPGTYYYFAYVDPVPGERYYYNNYYNYYDRTANNTSAYVTVTVSAPPDLTVSLDRVRQATFAPGERFTLEATVSNIGTGVSALTELRVYEDRDDYRRERQIARDRMSAISAGRSTSVSIPLAAPPDGGTYYYRVYVDTVTGETETDNNYSHWISIDVLEPLVLESLEPSKVTLTSGESFTLTATVKNDGDARSDATTVRYYRSSDNNLSSRDTLLGNRTVSRLAAGATTQVSIPLTAPQLPGTYYYGACVGDSQTYSGDACEVIKLTVLAVVLPASERPPMYWIDAEAGVLQSLMGSDVQRLVPSVQNARGIVVDAAGDKIYWIEKTGNRSGRIRSANLDGTNARLVKELTSVPMGIALNTSDKKLYLTNAWGKVQSLGVDGKNFQPNLVTGLDAPQELAVDAAGGKIYWIEQVDDSNGRIQRADLDGKNVKLVKNLTSVLTGLAVDTANGKLYLTNARGKVQQMDVDGRNFQSDLITGLNAPQGIVVDAAAGKIYWTEAGRIRRANLDGTNRQNVVTGLGTPASLSISSAPVEVLIPQSQRPPIYWQTAAGLQHLTGATVDNFAQAVQNATGIAVDAAAGKVYWTEQTGKTSGRIRSANLNGANVRVVKELTSVPMGIAVDTSNRRLYITNGWGKVQSLGVDGSNFRSNLVTGLDAPRGIAVDAAAGKVYWTEQTGSRSGRIRSANLNGANVRLVKELTSVPMGIAVDAINKKLYLTNAWGKVQQIDVNGKNFQPNLIIGLDAPRGIAVDAAGGKLYWAARGKIQRANLNGRNVQDVVTGLGAPVGIALNVSAPRNAAAAPSAAAMAPNTTALLTNYPNPFNPETWIPYQLRDAADVQISIYDQRGVLVRQLSLGHRVAGQYVSRSRAAYWDGRNEVGEPVASGLYFYTLTAGDFTATRKMLIVK